MEDSKLSRAADALAFSAAGAGATVVLLWTTGVLGFLTGGAAAFCGATGAAAFCGAAGAAAGSDFVFGFFALALSFFERFFFLSAADFDFSARNSDFSCLICFFSSFLRVSTCLLAISIPRRWL
jgi:hypothetical protein